ncbi:alpha/beta hydrolase family protein [Spongiactinospora sp. 9N601]|uniref:alpha/beta hydrolase family protein n=1 Tax=Spongiactinospora sp. 9N601 TaxID=3375149 RepID=UPI0037AE7359
MLSLSKSSALAALLAVFAVTALLTAPPAGAGTVVRTEVTIDSGDVRLRGMIYAPAATGRRAPAVVMVDGAGPRSLDDKAGQAAEFARRGVVALVYDKRTKGYSQTSRSFPALAQDALAGVRLLRRQPGVDPGRVGLWGFSEGGWVAPLAASRSPEVAFLVTVGAGGHSPERVQVWSNAIHLAHAGVTGARIRPLAVNLTRVMVGAGLFGAAGHEPVPVLARIDRPVLALWGEHERSIPAADSSRIFAATLRAAGNPSHTIKILPGADHGLMRSPDGFIEGDGLVPGYLELVTSWIHGLDDPPASSADAPPRQDLPAEPVTPLAWWESVPVQLGALTVLLVAFAGYPVAALIRRRRGAADGADRARRWPALLAATGVVTVLGTVLYLGYLLATAAGAPGPVVAGRPVVWLVLQVFAVAAAVATVGTALTLRRTGGAGRLALTGGVLLIGWAAYWGLFVP